jgi:hypothetical protein
MTTVATAMPITTTMVLPSPTRRAHAARALARGALLAKVGQRLVGMRLVRMRLVGMRLAGMRLAGILVRVLFCFSLSLSAFYWLLKEVGHPLSPRSRRLITSAHHISRAASQIFHKVRNTYRATRCA